MIFSEKRDQSLGISHREITGPQTMAGKTHVRPVNFLKLSCSKVGKSSQIQARSGKSPKSPGAYVSHIWIGLVWVNLACWLHMAQCIFHSHSNWSVGRLFFLIPHPVASEHRWLVKAPRWIHSVPDVSGRRSRRSHYDVKSQSFNPGLQYPHLHGPVHTPDNNRWDTPPV